MSNTHKIKLGKSKSFGIAFIDKEDRQRVEAEGTWQLHKTGYAYRNKSINNKKQTVYLHRFIVGLEHGDGLQVDHIDGNKLNNSKENLRIVSAGQNAQNKTKSLGVSKYRGVSKDKNKWIGSVNIPGEKRLRKTFATEEEAAIWCQENRNKHLPYALPDPEVVKLQERIIEEEQFELELREDYPNASNLEYDYNEYYGFAEEVIC